MIIHNRIQTKRDQDRFVSYVCLLLLCLPTAVFPHMVSTIIKYGKYLSYIWSVLLFFVLKVYRQKRLWPLWLFLITDGIAIILNQEGLNWYISFAAPAFSAIIIAYSLICYGRKDILFKVGTFFSLLLIGQGITALVGGVGTVTTLWATYPNYFFGQRVNFSNIMLYGLGISALSAVYGRGKERLLFAFSLIACVYFVLYERLSTGVISLVALVGVYTISGAIRKKFSWKILVLSLVGISLVFNITGQLIGSEWITEGLLGEGVTLNGRTLIWADAVSQMRSWHWLLGNGYSAQADLFHAGDFYANTAHSQYLNILFYFGGVSLAIYIWMIFSELKWGYGVTDEKARRIVISIISATIITGIPTTTFLGVYIYVTYVIIVYLGDITANRAIKQKGTRISFRLKKRNVISAQEGTGKKIV